MVMIKSSNQDGFYSDSDILEYIAGIHGHSEKVIGQSIEKRINKHHHFIFVENFPISNLNLEEWKIDYDYLTSLVEWFDPDKGHKINPIVVTSKNSIIDGVHR